MIDIPREAEELLQVLYNKGYDAYIVGGFVRDYLLKTKAKDLDICTSAKVEELIKIFKDYKLFKTGLRHNTLTVLINDYTIEVTTYRARDLKHDLLNRDFTINSLAYSPKTGIIDVSGGVADIKNKIIRINGKSDKVLIDDPLRILRAIKFSIKYNFVIDDKTKQYLFKNKDLLRNVSVERINAEFSEVITLSNFIDAFKEYFAIITVFIPELGEIENFAQHSPYHIYDCLNHTFKVMENVSDNLLIRLSALFHDIGKPKTFTLDEKGIGHFYGHYKESVEIAKKVLKRLKYDKETIFRVKELIYYHDYSLPMNKKSARKLLYKFGLIDIELLYELKKADLSAQNPDYFYMFADIEKSWNIIESVKEDCFSLQNLDIKGADIINMGISNGKEIGQLLNKVLELVVEGKVENKKEELLREARKLIKIK